MPIFVRKFSLSIYRKRMRRRRIETHQRMKALFKPNDISHYRQALMGIGILGVMAIHWCLWDGLQYISDGLYNLCKVLVALVFTEGFLFLSGFGLYYSFSRNPDIRSFYHRRIKRLYLPFFLLSLPLYLFLLITDKEYGIVTFVEQITTVYFWTHGNYGNGMWYVAVSLALYFLFPFIYRFLFSNKETKVILVKGIVLLLLIFSVNVAIAVLNHEYFQRASLGITKIPMFFLGMLFAYFTKNGELSEKNYLYLIILFAALYLGLSFLRKYFDFWAGVSMAMVQKMVFMPLICAFLSVLEKIKLGVIIKQPLDWFGKYSLELYLLHLNIYLFLSKCNLFGSITVVWKATLAMIAAIVLCVPTNKFLSCLINKKTESVSPGHRETR